MNIRSYLEVEKISQTTFANRLGVSQGLIHQWIKGVTRITAERAIQIDSVTGGKVPKSELRPEIFGDKAA